jgi:hypothetical protein
MRVSRVSAANSGTSPTRVALDEKRGGSGQLQRDFKHIEAIHRHPARAMGLLEKQARRKLGTSIKNADVIET